jgi:hypothetical protein
VGAAAFSAAVTGKISIAVVVFELTKDLSFGIPVLLAVCVAHTVGGRVSAPIYDRIAIEIKHLPHWPCLARTESNFLTASDVMVPLKNRLEAIAICTTADAIRERIHAIDR